MLVVFWLFFFVLKSIDGIYVPNSSDQARAKHALGAKTLTWQNPDSPAANGGVQVYENYTNVKLQQHENSDNLKQLYANNNRPQQGEQSQTESIEPFDMDPVSSENVEKVRNGNSDLRQVRKYSPIKQRDGDNAQSDNDFAGSQNTPIYSNLPTSDQQVDEISCVLNCRTRNRNPQEQDQPRLRGYPTDYPIIPQCYPTNPHTGNNRPQLFYITSQVVPVYTRPPVATSYSGTTISGVPYRPLRGHPTQYQPQQPEFPTSFQHAVQPFSQRPRVDPQFPSQFQPQPTTRPQNQFQPPFGSQTRPPFPTQFKPELQPLPHRPLQPHQSNSFRPQVNPNRQYPENQYQNVIIPQNYYSGRLQTVPRAASSPSKCAPGVTGQFPDETSCNRFLNCWRGRGVVQNCAPGTLFNPETLECDFPEKVHCASRQPRFERLVVGKEAVCPPGFSGIVPHYQDCTMFLSCEDGRQAALHCPPGTLFDVQTNVCDHAYRVQCVNQAPKTPRYIESSRYTLAIPSRPRADNNNPGSSQNAPQTPPKCPPAFAGLLPHPVECGKFLSCANGMTHVMDCGPGTYFNPSLSVCDHAHNVPCNQPEANRPTEGQQYPNFEKPQAPLSYEPSTSASILNGHQQNAHYTIPNYPRGYNPFQGQPTREENLDQQVEELWQSTFEVSTPAYEILTPRSNRKVWPPPFPTNSADNDYVFEYDDLVEVEPQSLLSTTPLPLPQRTLQAPSMHIPCTNQTFNCGDNHCIVATGICNGEKDCPNGSDERDCALRLRDFLKTSGTKLAVKERNKLPNVTLAWCATTCAKLNCKGFNFRKHDGTCYILDSNVGTSGALIILPMYDYYENQKYTISCDQIDGYLCNNQKCIGKQRVCDGVNDCGDGADEKGCTADAFNYKLRLIGDDDHSGRLEVEVFGKVGYICDDMFGLKNADVACRELGFSLGAVEVRGNSFFASEIQDNDTVYLMDDVMCLGNETSLRDCDFSGWGISNCKPQEIVGVVCKTPVEICPKDHWKCQNNVECLPLAFVCDGVYDCTDRTDESSKFCDAPPKLRLTEGAQGRLEVMHNGIWGTVCDDDFNDDAAKVACAQLGYNGSAKVVKDGHFGPGTGPIWLDQVFCRGNESALEDCIHWEWGEHNCEHTEDVGVICNSKSLPELGILGSGRHQQNVDVDLDDGRLPERCGLRNDAIFHNQDDPEEAHFRVVKAGTAKIGEYPWQASIRVKGKTKSAHWCGAVVIASKFVLTAAHCLLGFSKGAYFIVAGDYNVDQDEGSEQEAYIEDFVIHPKFGQGNKMNNDIALVRLKGKGLVITGNVQPVCLPPPDVDYPVGLNCTISGFGSIENGKSKASRDLRAGWIPILSADVCRMPHVYGAAITEGMLCAGFLQNGVDACDGDSGGPLACLHEGVFKLYGLTSWGQHCGYANKPGVYVHVAKYRRWIEDTMKALSA